MLKERSITAAQSTGGLCTWALRLLNGAYVVDLNNKHASTFDVRSAHVWLSEERAREVAAETPWIGPLGATAVRSRP